MRGAVLVKVLPNAQQFNPADPTYKSFYRALAERKLPFLSHVGYEFGLIGKDQSVGDPDRSVWRWTKAPPSLRPMPAAMG